MVLRGVTIGHIGGMLLAQVLVTGNSSRFEADNVVLNDVSVIAKGDGMALVKNCVIHGTVTPHPQTGGEVDVRCVD